MVSCLNYIMPPMKWKDDEQSMNALSTKL